MTKNYQQSFKINHNLIWPDIPDHPYKILIIGGSRSGKINVLLNLIKHQRLDIDQYQLLINGRDKVGIKKLKITTVFID